MRIPGVLGWVLPVLAGAVAVTAHATTDEEAGAADSDRLVLLQMHQNVLDAHHNQDLDAWLRDESDDYVLVNRGEISTPDKKARRAALGPYLDQTTFHEYEDLVPPRVRISADGTMGWVVAQVHVTGTHHTPDGKAADLDVTWAWIELYEKRDGRWLRTGNVSNQKPAATPAGQ